MKLRDKRNKQKMEEKMRRFNVTVNGKSYAVEVEEVGGAQPVFTYAPAQPAPAPAAPAPQPSPKAEAPAATAPAKKAQSGPVAGETMTAPMPGTIIDIRVTEGQSVKAGDIVLILEAMKMENEIVAPSDGTIAKIYTSKGESVSTGDSLVTIA
jgi:glutaconyl-CoA decarboxylase